MRRTNTFCLDPTKQQNEILNQLGSLSATLWNKISYNRRQCLFNDYPIDWQLSFYKDFSNQLGSSFSQQIYRKNGESWRGFFKLCKLKAQHKLPSEVISPHGYWKNRDTGKKVFRIIVRNDCYSLKGKLRIPTSKKIRKQYGTKQLILKYKGNLKWKGKQARLELVYNDLKNKWYVYQTLEVPEIKKKPTKKKAYVDLGVINPFTILSDKPTIYNGGSMLADWWYWNKKIAKHQSELKKANKKNTSKQLRRLFAKRQNRYKHAINSLIKNFLESCLKEGITEIRVGDVRGIIQNNNKGKKTNTMIHNLWGFGYTLSRLENKTEEYGLTLNYVNEKYTSRTCPICDHKEKGNRKHRGLFVCKECGYTQNADIVGAINIKKNDNPDFSFENRDNRVMAHPLLFSWNRNNWGTRISRL